MDRPVFSGWHYGTVPGSLSAPPRGPALQQLLVAKDGIMHHLPILFKLHEIWSVDSRENHQNCCHQMSDFKTQMHQISFRLGQK